MKYLPLLLLASCFHTPCPSGATPPISFQEMRQVWEHRFGELPSDCDDDVKFVIWPNATFDRVCPPNASGCTYVSYICPVSYLSDRYSSDKYLWTHEYAHWLLHCSTGDGDPKHTRQDVWGPNGFEYAF